MTDSDYARRQLQTIRALMERATVYRALSVPAALVGGLLSLGGFAVACTAEYEWNGPLAPDEFLKVWLVILALTVVANLIFLWRSSRVRQEPFFSSGMRCAMTSLAPAFIAAGVLTAVLDHPIQFAIAWLILYGIALLGTQHFAPRSLVLLGVAFFVTGCVLLATWKHVFAAMGHGEPSAMAVSGVLAATFGGYHLIYALAVWARSEARTRLRTVNKSAEHV